MGRKSEVMSQFIARGPALHPTQSSQPSKWRFSRYVKSPMSVLCDYYWPKRRTYLWTVKAYNTISVSICARKAKTTVSGHFSQTVGNCCTSNRHLPSTRVGQLSIRADRPFRNIWCRNRSVSEFRKIELTSSWLHGGSFEEADILNGLRKPVTKMFSCSTYSSSASTIRNTRLKQSCIKAPGGNIDHLECQDEVDVFNNKKLNQRSKQPPSKISIWNKHRVKEDWKWNNVKFGDEEYTIQTQYWNRELISTPN